VLLEGKDLGVITKDPNPRYKDQTWNFHTSLLWVPDLNSRTKRDILETLNDLLAVGHIFAHS